MYIFKEKFHDYVFVDAKGTEYAAVVEFAPFQRMGRVRSKPDRKCNTYEANEHYQEFIRVMDTEEALPKLELKSDFDVKHDNQIRSTPLLEFLNDRKGKKRDKDRKQQQDKKKKILAPIKEDASATGTAGKENVRRPKERPNKPTQQGNQKEDPEKKKERPERSEKEKARRMERDKLRREKRQQMAVEKKREKEATKQDSSTGAPASLADTTTKEAVGESGSSSGNADPQKKPPREGKKYSDRRNENRSKQSNSKRTEDNSKDPQGDGKEGTSTTGEGGEKKKESRRYSERRIRNKDRPAIQIYTPGSKVRKGDE